MYDDIFDLDSFNDISDYGNATESMFDYGADDYALEAEDFFDKVKDTVRKIIDGLKQTIAVAIQTVRHFLFGQKDQFDDSITLKFSAAGYYKALWQACYKDALNKLTGKTKSFEKKQGISPFLGDADFDEYALEADAAKEREKLSDAAKSSNVQYGIALRDFARAIDDIVETAQGNSDYEVAKLFNTSIKSSMMQQLSSGADTPGRKAANEAINGLKTIQSAAVKTAEANGKKVKKPELITAFKAFCGSIARFFKYAGGVVKLSMKSSKLARKARKAAGIADDVVKKYGKKGGGLTKTGEKIVDRADIAYAKLNQIDAAERRVGDNGKSNKTPGFLGRIANESYVEGYYAALNEMGIDLDDAHQDDYASESAVAVAFDW